MKKKTKWVLSITGIVVAIVVIFTATPAKWLLRIDCLCYRGRFHPLEHYTPDSVFFDAAGEIELNDNIQLLTATCKHGEPLLLQVFGREYYTIHPME